MSMRIEPIDDDLARGSAIKLALRARAALARRERWLEQAVIDFDAAVPERILSDERSEQALEDAETAEALDQAMELDRGDIKEWTAKAMTLLRAIPGRRRGLQTGARGGVRPLSPGDHDRQRGEWRAGELHALVQRPKRDSE